MMELVSTLVLASCGVLMAWCLYSLARLEFVSREIQRQIELDVYDFIDVEFSCGGMDGLYRKMMLTLKSPSVRYQELKNSR